MLCSPDGSNEKDSGEICAKDEDTGISIRNVLKKFRSTLNVKLLTAIYLIVLRYYWRSMSWSFVLQLKP